MLSAAAGAGGRWRLQPVFVARRHAWRAGCVSVAVDNGGLQRSGSSVGGRGRLAHPPLLLPGFVTAQRQIAVSCVKSLRVFSTSSFSASPEDAGRLVYAGSLARAVLGVKFFSYSTSMFSMCMMPYVMFKSGVGVESFALQMAFYSIVGFFTFVTPFVLHLMTKGYIVRLYHKPETDTYTAITYNVLLAEKRTIFHQSDVAVPGISKMFTTFYARSKSMLVNPMLFSSPQEYSHLMGYDKPFTFDMEELKEPEDNK